MSLYQTNFAAPRLVRNPRFTSDAAGSNRGTSDDRPCDARVRLYERALRRDPRNHFLLIDLAREYGLHQRLLDADNTLLRVLDLYPGSAKVRSMVAASYARIGLPHQARQHYRQALELNPQHPESAAIRAELSSLDA